MAKVFIKPENGKLVVPEAENQCAFHVNASDNVCSDTSTLGKMQQFIGRLESTSNATKFNLKPAEIVDQAKKLTGCGSEICVLKNKEFGEFAGTAAVEDTIHKRFKPEGPSHSTEWLNNDNIDFVINQWSKIYPGFLHVPFQMIDFDEQQSRLSQLDLADEYSKGTRKMGCVINTDKSTGRGIHWFCIFADLTDEAPNGYWTLEYFDSAGDYPKRSVHAWLNKQRSILAAKYPGKRIEVVDVTKSNQLQRSTTECGVFSLWYILSRLNGIPHSYFSQASAINDDMMYKFRKFLFRHDLSRGGAKKKNKH
jgi:hypothetical protein